MGRAKSSAAGGRDRARRQLLRLVDEYEGLRVFVGWHGKRDRVTMELNREAVEAMTKRQAEEHIAELDAEIGRLRQRFGITKPKGYFGNLLAEVRTHVPGDMLLFVAKAELKEDVPHIEEVDTSLRKLPEHARMSVDIHGIMARGAPREVRLLEVVFFEDACALLNRLLQLEEAIASGDKTKATVKEAAACRRGAVASAFYMVEAYVNSLAFAALRDARLKLTAADRAKLEEWDPKRGRPRFLSLRDKLLQYPRIATGRSHPVLQDTNCPQLLFLCEEAKALRDAIVHASPVPQHGHGFPEKEMAVWTLSTDKVIGVIDNAIQLVRLLEVEVHGSAERLFWLQDRAVGGAFDRTVFD